MKRRLEQLAEEAVPFKDDPQAGPQKDDPMMDKDRARVLDEILQRLAKNTEHKSTIYQNELGYSSIPSSAPKSARDIAEAPAWTGRESAYDVSVRLLNDKHKPKKGVLQPPKGRKTSSVSERLANARERSLDHRLNSKKSYQDNRSTDQEKEMGFAITAEKFLGPVGASGVISSIHSLASQRIEDAMAKGEFKNIPRGKRLEPINNLPYVGMTEYFLNEMIQREGAAPPWIERQTKLNVEIDQFRRRLLQSLQTRLIKNVLDKTHGLSAKQRIEFSKKHYIHHRSSRDREWEIEHQEYHQLSIAEVNNTIRSYNLQAPESARRGYLDLERELVSACETVVSNLTVAIQSYHKVPIPPPVIESQSIARDQLHVKSKHELYSEDPNNYYGVKDLARDLFKKVWG